MDSGIVITIGGPPGSGTTTVSKILEERMGMKHVYIGAIFRELAREHNMDLDNFGDYSSEHPEIDIELDRKTIDIAKGGNVIIEGRLAGWMLHDNGLPAFKTWIKADLDVRAERVKEREDGDLEDIKVGITKREKSEKERYHNIYNIDLDSMDIYDLVVDSTDLDPEEVADQILDYYKRFLNNMNS